MSVADIIPFPVSPSSQENDVDDPPTAKEAIGAVLREERQTQDRTLADVAESAAVSLPYLSEIERGRKDVSSELLESVTKALEISVADVFERAARRLRVESKIGGEMMLLATWLSQHLIDHAVIERFLASQDKRSVGVGTQIVTRPTEVPSQQLFGLVSNPCEFGGLERQVTDRAASGF